MRLKGKVAIVTGAGSGIGRGICLRFAEEGARIVAADYQEKGNEETARLVREKGGEAVTVTGDVSKRPDVQRIFARALEHYKGYDILINNAGILTSGSILELTEEAWDKVIAVNLKGMFLCTQEAAKYWVTNKRPGKIVNMGSVNSEFAVPGHPHYCASKGGVKMFTKAVALELAPHGINVNAIGPGGTQTMISPSFAKPEVVEQIGKGVPLGRMAQPRDIANLALFLVSEDGAYITGQLIFSDGGKTARLG